MHQKGGTRESKGKWLNLVKPFNCKLMGNKQMENFLLYIIFNCLYIRQCYLGTLESDNYVRVYIGKELVRNLN